MVNNHTVLIRGTRNSWWWRSPGSIRKLLLTSADLLVCNPLGVATNSSGKHRRSCVLQINISDHASSNMKTYALQDTTLKNFIQMKKSSKERPVWEDILSEGPVLKTPWTQWDRMEVRNGVLYRRWESDKGDRIVYQCFRTLLYIIYYIFLNDLEIKLGNETLGFKYADDCTIIAPLYYDIVHSVDLISQFLQWAGQNRMTSNSTKCKELLCIKKVTLLRPTKVFLA